MGPESPHGRDHLVARIAGRQHGVISLAQLLRAGLTPKAIKVRVATGRLFRIHRGVYAVGYPRLTDHGRWKAATLALGPRAVLSHRSAAELWGLLRSGGGMPQVSLPYPASPAKRKGIRIFRSRPLARARTTSREGIPVTMPAQTLADLARVASPAQVRRARRQAEVLGLPLDPDHVSDRTRSDLEGDFRRICTRYGVPAPATNVRIGPHRVDFFWPEAKLVVETDGYLYHRGRQAMRDDYDRDIELELRGLRVVRIDDTRIDQDPAGVAAAVLGLLRLNG